MKIGSVTEKAERRTLSRGAMLEVPQPVPSHLRRLGQTATTRNARHSGPRFSPCPYTVAAPSESLRFRPLAENSQELPPTSALPPIRFRSRYERNPLCPWRP